MPELTQTGEPSLQLQQFSVDRVLNKYRLALKARRPEEKNNNLTDYILSMTEPHATSQGWLTWYLNTAADRMDPSRHDYLNDFGQHVPRLDYEITAIGILPQAAHLYHLMLDEAHLLPQLTPATKNGVSFATHEKAMRNLFRQKTVYMIPARAGYEAKFMIDHGANVGMTTDSRYIDRVARLFGNKNHVLRDRRKLEKVAFVLNCPIKDALGVLSTLRPDLANMLPQERHANEPDNRVLYSNPKYLRSPDFVISENMFKKDRFAPTQNAHSILLTWQQLMHNILATGGDGTTYYIAASVDEDCVFGQDQLTGEFGELADIHFYNFDHSQDRSLRAGGGESSFSLKLKIPFREYLARSMSA